MKASETIESLEAIRYETLLHEVNVIILLLISLLNNLVILRQEKKFRDEFFSSDITLLRKAFSKAFDAIEEELQRIESEVI